MHNDIIQRPTHPPKARRPEYPDTTMQPMVVSQPPQGVRVASTGSPEPKAAQQASSRSTNTESPVPVPHSAQLRNTSQNLEQDEALTQEQPQKARSKSGKPIGVIVVTIMISVALVGLAVYVGTMQSNESSKQTTDVVS